MATIYNNIPIIGLFLFRLARRLTIISKSLAFGKVDGATRFDKNQAVTGYKEVAFPQSTIFNNQPVRGAVLITDGRAIHNTR